MTKHFLFPFLCLPPFYTLISPSLCPSSGAGSSEVYISRRNMSGRHGLPHFTEYTPNAAQQKEAAIWYNQYIFAIVLLKTYHILVSL